MKKNIIYDKINNITKEDSLKISGKFSGFGSYNLYDIKNDHKFDYKINAIINISYRGFKIPFMYNFSNGRSISRVDLPSFRTPTFSTFGISPSYKWVKAHIGNNRSMSFSEYTYQNIRFKGAGIELTPTNFLFKAFKGKLLLASNNDLAFQNNISFSYTRRALGFMSGYNSEDTKANFIVFKSYDDISGISVKEGTKNKPKANTVLGFVGQKKIFNSLKLELDYGLSALTQNTLSDTIDILTGNSVYNMLGLYTKTASSIYRAALKTSLSYEINEHIIKFNYTSIDKDYRTLGSLLYDNNYSSYTTSYSGPITKTLSISSEFGIRYEGHSNIDIPSNTPNNNRQLILNTSASYKLSDAITLNSSYSNFRKSSRLYHQNLATLEYDSISLALINSNFNFSSNYIFGEDKKSMLNFMFSTQNSSSIQNDSVYTNNHIKNKLFNLNYNKTNEKYTLNSSISCIINNSNSIKTISIIPNIKTTFKLLEDLNLTNALTFNFTKSDQINRKQLLFTNGIKYKYNKNNDLDFNTKINFTDYKEQFKLIEILLDLTINSKF